MGWYEAATAELEEYARDFEAWTVGTEVYRLRSGRYVSEVDFTRVLGTRASAYESVANWALCPAAALTLPPEYVEAVARASCESTEAVCYYTEVDY